MCIRDRSNIAFTEATVLKTTEAAASVASNVATTLQRVVELALRVDVDSKPRPLRVVEPRSVRTITDNFTLNHGRIIQQAR